MIDPVTPLEVNQPTTYSFQVRSDLMTNIKLTAALELAEYGYRVFPVVPGGKSPACKHGCKDSTCDATTIEKWWAQNPDYNIGLSTDGLIVIDVDGRDNPWLLDPERALLLSVAPSAETQSGGRHFFFRQSNGISIRNSTSKLADRVDIRADGGYVVVAPSTGALGAYKWIQPLEVRPDMLPTLPPDIKIPSKLSATDVPICADPIVEGRRNAELTQIAGMLRRNHKTESEMADDLHVINLSKCQPPLPQPEVEAIAASIARYPSAHEQTDLGNARRMIELYGDDLRFVATWNKWLFWHDGRWSADETGIAHRYAQETVRSMLLQASECSNEDRRRDLIKWGKQSQSRARLESMLKLASTQIEVAISHEELDRHPHLLNCRNGIVDLKTGILGAADRSKLLTQQVDIEYSEGAAEPLLWLKTLHRVLNDDLDLITFVKRLVGYSLSGEVTEQVLPIFYGDGANGKSVFVETIMNILGDYAKKAPRGFGIATRHDRHATELADLCGARLVVITETGAEHRLDEPLIKEITGGDTIRARRMREDFWEFRPSHMCLMVTNHRPIVRGGDHGIWRRLLLIPFDVTIPEQEQDKNLARKLNAEYAGILRWMVEGYIEYSHMGLQPPKSVQAATDEYRQDMDVVARFVNACCVVKSEYSTKAGHLFTAYKAWCEANSEPMIGQTAFLTQIRKRYGLHCRRSNGSHYDGIGLLGDTIQEAA